MASDAPSVAPRVVRSAARNSALGAVGAIISSVAGFVFALLVGRALGVDDTGTLFACVAVTMVLITLTSLGAETGLLWSLSRDRAATGGHGARRLIFRAAGPVLVVGAVVATGLLWLAPRIATSIATPDATEAAASMLRVCAAAVMAGALLQCLLQASRALGSVVPFTLVQQVGVPVGRVLLVSAAVGLGLGGPEMMLAWAVPVVLALPVIAAVLRRRSAPPPTPAPAGAAEVTGREFWAYSLLRSIGTAASMCLTWLDVLLVAIFASPAAAGAYAAASRFASSGVLGLQAMRLGIAPLVAAAFARHDTRTAQGLYNLSAQGATLVSWPIFWTLIVFGDTALGWFGDGFGAAGTALVVLSAAMMLNVSFGTVATLLLMSGHSGWASRNTVCALVVTVGIDLVLIPQLGATGAAIGWLAGVVTENALGLWLLRYRLGVRSDPGTLLVVAGLVSVTSLLSAAAGLAVFGQGSPGLALAAVLSVLGSALVAWVLRRRLQLHLLRGVVRRSRAGKEST